MSEIFNHIVNSESELRNILGYPSKTVMNKTIHYVDSHCREFISKSPLLFMSTSDKEGNCDVSPRGDDAGFVLVLDNNHIVIPERPGNKKLDSIINILSNPNIGLIFIIPGLEETLRINGKATIVRDDYILQQLQYQGKAPQLAIGVKVEECFIHCAKAFKRSQVWDHRTWLEKDEYPNVPKIISSHVGLPDVDEEKIREALNESYTKRLY